VVVVAQWGFWGGTDEDQQFQQGDIDRDYPEPGNLGEHG
jgi:hypothetical protein